MGEYVAGSNLQEIVGADFPNYEFKTDERLFLYDKFVPLLKSGEKVTTVRYGGGKIRLPVSNRIPLFETKKSNKDHIKNLGYLEISKVVIKRFCELTDEDGRRDGFSGKSELVMVIESIYGTVKPDDLVSIYHLELV